MNRIFVRPGLIFAVFLSSLTLIFLLIVENNFVSATHDQLSENPVLVAYGPENAPDGFCINQTEGDLTHLYTSGRYVKFPSYSATGYRISGSSFGLPSECDTTNATDIFFLDKPATNNLFPTVQLYATNPEHDTTPPTQSNITAGSITQTGATVTWTTNESATHTIKYGTTSGSYDSYPTTKSAGSGTSASGAL